MQRQYLEGVIELLKNMRDTKAESTRQAAELVGDVRCRRKTCLYLWQRTFSASGKGDLRAGRRAGACFSSA